MVVFDIEADGLLLDVTKIHVLSWYDTKTKEEGSITDYDEMSEWLLDQTTLIGHNIVQYDIPTLERVLGITIKAKLIDTLALSWYLFPDRQRHGLEWWGEEFGVLKPEVIDWKDQEVSVYIHRCEQDVQINLKLWELQKRKLSRLYKTSVPEKLRIIPYLTFKMDCLREQYRSKWKLDKELATKTLATLERLQEEKSILLKGAMPKVPQLAKRTPPAKPFKKDGTYSVAGAKWFKLILDRGLTKGHTDPIYETTGYEEPNPSSPEQIKAWLFSLGWEPQTFDYVKDKKTGATREVPQIKKPHQPELCDSIIDLFEREPVLQELEGLSIIKHRLGVVKGFLNSVDEEGFVRAEAQGFTNTLRFKHRKPCVNLPGVDKPWGKELRGCFVARDGYEFCGYDMVSLEATTKRHFMYPYDPEYSDEIGKEGFDEHLDVAVHAGRLTRDQVENHKLGVENYGSVRKTFKAVNYSAIYGIGAPKLSKEIKSTEKEARALLDAYWERNWSIRKVAEDQDIVHLDGEMWLLNPVNGFLYSLRAKKDIFSTLNQGTGAYCFDSFLAEVRKRRNQLTAQFHDEGVSEIKLGNRERMKSLLQESIEAANKKLKLNVELNISCDFGHRYSDIH